MPIFAVAGVHSCLPLPVNIGHIWCSPEFVLARARCELRLVAPSSEALVAGASVSLQSVRCPAYPTAHIW